MNLELNLVNSSGIYSKSFGLIVRGRKEIESPTTVKIMESIKSFLEDNIDIIESAVSDKSFTSQLTSLDFNIDTLYSVKYVLALHGIDLLVYEVSKTEANANEIPDDYIEYNIVDKLEESPILFCTKLNGSKEGGLGELYEKIGEIYNIFNGTAFESIKNPYKEGVNTLKSIEKSSGVTPINLTNYLNSILEYFGKEVLLITN